MTTSAASELEIPEGSIAYGVIDEEYGQFTWLIDQEGKLDEKRNVYEFAVCRIKKCGKCQQLGK